MKSLFVVYVKDGKSTKRIYFRANNIFELISAIKHKDIFGLINHINFPARDIRQIKRLKRIYRKTDFIVEV